MKYIYDYLFESFFDDIDNDDINNAPDDESLISTRPTDGVLSYDYYMDIRYKPSNRISGSASMYYKDGDKDVYTDIVPVKSIMDGIRTILDSEDFLDNYFLQKPIITDLSNSGLTNKSFIIPDEFITNSCDYTELLATHNDKIKPHGYVTAPRFEFRVYFNKKDIHYLPYDKYIKMIMSLTNKFHILFKKFRYNDIEHWSFFENVHTEEEVIDNTVGKKVTPGLSLVGLNDTDNYDAVYRLFYDKDKMPTDIDTYENQGGTNYFRNYVRNQFINNFDKLINNGIQKAKKHFNIDLKLYSKQNLQVKENSTSNHYSFAYLVFDLLGPDNVDTDDLEDCMISCFLNYVPLLLCKMFTLYIALRPINCNIEFTSDKTGRYKENRRHIFKNTPFEIRCENKDISILGTKKEYLSYRTSDAEIDDKGRYYHTVSHSYPKNELRLRTGSYSWRGAGTDIVIAFLDKKGVCMSNAMKCHFGDAFLTEFIQNYLPDVFGYKLKKC